MLAPTIRWMGIDPSIDLGWAHGAMGEKPIFGVHKLPSKLSISKRNVELESFIISMITANDIGEVYIERPILPKITSFDAILTLASYAAVTGMACTKCGISCRFIDMQKWRSIIGSPTQAPKMRPIEAATILGISVEDFSKGAKKTVDGRMKAARRKWIKDQNIANLKKVHGIDTDDDNAADAAGIWKAVEINKMRDRDKAAYDLFEDLKV